MMVKLVTLPLVNSGAYNPEKVISFWLKICTYAHMENEHEIWVLSILSTPPSPGTDHTLFFTIIILFQYGVFASYAHASLRN